MIEIVGAFGGVELGEGVGYCADQVIKGSRCGFSQQRFQFGEYLLDGIEVGAVRRQIAQAGPGFFDGLLDTGNLVARQIIHDDNVADPQRRSQELLHPGEKSFAVHGSVEQARRGDLIIAQRAHESRCFPMAERNIRHEPVAARAAAIKSRHFG